MKRVVVLGHGGYAEGVKQNLAMIVGEPSHMYFADLTREDDLTSFENKVNALLENFQREDEILFTCDLLGATPFRVAAMHCVNHPGRYYTAAGLNTMAFLELSMESDLTIEELASRAVETTRASAARFPE